MEESKVGLIVVGVDGSEDGLRAVRLAAGIAQRFEAELLLVHAVDDAMLAGAWGVVYDPEVLQNAGVTANEQAKALAIETGLPESRIRSEVVLGSPGGVLSRMSEVADLLIVGRRSVSGLERMFVGSTSVSAVANAACPVVVISAAAHPQDVGSRGVIGVGVNTSPRNTHTLETAFKLASRFGTRLEVVHALQPPIGIFGSKLSPDNLEEQLRFTRGGIEAVAQATAANFPTVDYQVKVVVDSPINELVTRSNEYDILVLGTGEQGIPGFGLGGLLRGLMAHAACPLYIAN